MAWPLTDSANWKLATCATGAKSTSGSYGSFVKTSGASTVTTIGVSISRLPSAGRVADRLGDDPAAGAGPVLDDDRLLQLVLHAVGEQARRDVGRAAGREADQQAHRLVDLRERDGRGRRSNAEPEGDLLQRLHAMSPSVVPAIRAAARRFSPLCYGARVDFALWSAIVGLLLVVMALSDSVLARLPLSTSMLYLLVGVAVSPLWLGLASLTPTSHAQARSSTSPRSSCCCRCSGSG